ncbi:MAG: hypothetical protein JWQ25_814 [Daejeonella sp.]|nr:hypothetical protein [Daejeonella sp.]
MKEKAKNVSLHLEIKSFESKRIELQNTETYVFDKQYAK